MLKIQILICALFGVIAITSAVSVPAIKQSGSIDEIILVNSIEDYIKANPNVTVIPMKKEVQSAKDKSVPLKVHIRYTVGNRNGYDDIIATEQNSYISQQNVEFLLSYPKSGNGLILTFVEIDVNQSSSIGEAYVVAGGVGARFIEIIVEARQLTYFHYKASFYGY